MPLKYTFHSTIDFADWANGPSTLDLYIVDHWRGTPEIRDDEHVVLDWFTPTAAARLSEFALDRYRAVFARL